MFESARIKLTVWYLLIIMIISLSFTAVIYRLLDREVVRFAHQQRLRIERRLTDGCPSIAQPPLDAELVSETKHRLLMSLLFVNASIFVAAGGFGYVLAGKTLNPIKAMVEDQNRFIGDTSHELKTPLTSLKTSFEVYLRDKKKNVKKADQLISESISEVDKLQSLSESLLQLSLYQQPVAQQSFETTSLVKVVTTAIQKVQPLADEKDITLKPPTKDATVWGDAQMLVQLFVILLDNAIKYSPQKSAVSTQITQKSGHAQIVVADTGLGIAEADIPHIFDRFYRADQARTKTNQGGYGLGLSIAHSIVSTHQGTITVTSKLGTGSTFIVTFPRRKKA